MKVDEQTPHEVKKDLIPFCKYLMSFNYKLSKFVEEVEDRIESFLEFNGYEYGYSRIKMDEEMEEFEIRIFDVPEGNRCKKYTTTLTWNEIENFDSGDGEISPVEFLGST